MTDEATIAHLVAVLALDPARDAAEVMALRAKHRADMQGASVARPRHELAEALEELRATFHTLDAGAFSAALASLALDDWPDLQRVREQLRVANTLREEREGIMTVASTSPRLSAALQSIVLEPRAVAAVLREEERVAHRRWLAAWRARRFVKRVRAVAPGTAALESEWLASLGRTGRGRGERTLGGLLWDTACMLFIAGLALGVLSTILGLLEPS